MARPPATPLESMIANCRPQPAIPALLVLVLTLMFAVSFGGQQGAAGEAGWPVWIIVAGIVVSCGLAIAAGFCSLFPPLSWMAVVWLGRGIVSGLPGSAYVRATVFAGMVAAAVMVVVQVWRVRTGKFSPTLNDGTGDRS